MKKLSLVAGLTLALFVAGCSSDETGGDTGTGSIGEQLDYTITGIDAGAGIMAAAEEVIEQYGLDEYTLQPSSDAAMTSALDNAIRNEEAIVVTGWTPHWKFAKYDVKYLKDPKGVFGEAEQIHTFARLGLDADLPEAYEVLSNFHWEQEHMGAIMIEVNEGKAPEVAAAEWVENNQDIVSAWTDGVQPVDGEAITLSFVAWDSEIASTHMIGKVLEDLGYDVTLTPLEPGPLWASIATGAADAMVSAWLPGTHAAYLEDYEDEIVDLGVNLEGAKIGLVVPSYMDIDSIEDLLE
ncbi:glycine betaine ABC transporter substrate-binding protein [Alkalihalobacillus sp. LMS39]|uniref:glycine betaine ABC transporter substrate-binding protein n=1 Tax=Alkalihalobacillus sp. LMS39 TaxID=2924032 RepID=UPI001FB20956|nr:glycine betaine ABC transporter substrate-binding protein [Alkalihalobacillus sp. LMS39]UOE92383.1 glycine/betaine ABC transporter [Alkalihalobacillus sp. LMS39]